MLDVAAWLSNYFEMAGDYIRQAIYDAMAWMLSYLTGGTEGVSAEWVKVRFWEIYASVYHYFRIANAWLPLTETISLLRVMSRIMSLMQSIRAIWRAIPFVSW